MVFYRTYRPQTIDELDSGRLRETLTAVLIGVSLPHAFLFTGPKGLGKTSTARILAKAINCERRKVSKVSKVPKVSEGETVEPCNACDQCTSITSGSSMDVMEIDAASNRGIDEIRDLRDKVRLAPVSARYKVYIIDEVHMLTTEAFNALLKTLEEPPAHVIFILCTTEPQKIPATIFSRCFHVQFQPATDEELRRSFLRIIKGEKASVDDDALNMIVALSDGGFRDGAKILEEILLLSGGKKVTGSIVEEKYHTKSMSQAASQLLTLLAQNDTKAAIILVNDVAGLGFDMRRFVAELLSHLHKMLLFHAGISQDTPAPTLSLAKISQFVRTLSDAYEDMRYAVVPQLPLELVIAELGEEADGDIDATGPVSSSPVPTSSVVTPRTASFDKNGLSWEDFIAAVKAKSHAVAGVLRGCRLKSFDGTTLVIETNYKFHKEKLDDKKAIALLEDVGKTMTGKPVKISVLLKDT